MRKGFTLIEMMIVMVIVAMLSSVLIVNFRSGATGIRGRSQAAAVVSSDLRRIQSMALAGSSWQSASMCGFGLHYVDSRSYLLFARPNDPGTPCIDDARPKRYRSGDVVIESKSVLGAPLSFEDAFPDVYYQIPYGRVYLDGAMTPGAADIGIMGNGSEVTHVIADTSGKIDIQN